MRYVYCACSVASMLGDWRGVNRDAAVEFIKSSITFDGAFAQGPDLESHAGSTLCALGALNLMGRLNTTLTPQQRNRLVQWLIYRQEVGFNG